MLLDKRLRRELPLHLMIFPGLALVIMFNYLPMLGSIMAFQDYSPVKGFFKSEWVGLDNFKFIASLPDTFLVLRNTVFIASMEIVGELIIPVILALLLNEIVSKTFKRAIQTLIYIPYFLSWIILGGIFLDVLSMKGILNTLLGYAGISPVYFLGDKSTFPYVLIVTDIWRNMGFDAVIFLAALTNISPELYEAASIDGAGRWKQTMKITIPGILPVIVLVSTLSIGYILSAGFEQVFIMYNPLVYETGDIIDTYVYRLGLLQARYSIATAVGLFKSVVSLGLVSASYYLAYKFADYRIF